MTKPTGIFPVSIEVDPAVVAAFLGRVTDPPPPTGGGNPQLDAALRAIMFTDLKGSTAMTTRLGDTKALHLLHIHNSLTRMHCVNTQGEKSST
jgi:class 3 adenylate cyclase